MLTPVSTYRQSSSGGRGRRSSCNVINSKLLLLLLLLASALSPSSAILNIANTLYRHSNELEQFERYEKFTSGTDFKALLDKWNNCMNAVSINANRLGCREQVRDELAKISTFMSNPLIAAFAREEDKARPGFYAPDCEYALDFGQSAASTSKFFDENHGNYFVFNIRARNCKSESKTGGKDALQQYRGGASFEIHASNVFHAVSCEVKDKFDDSYEVLCPLSKTLNNHHNSHMSDLHQVKVANHHMHPHEGASEHHQQKAGSNCSCFALSIILDFEHYDAFSELYYQRPQLNNIILDDDHVCVCNNGTTTISQKEDNSQGSAHFKTLILDETTTSASSASSDNNNHYNSDILVNRNT